MITKRAYRWFVAITLAALALNAILRLIPFDFVWDGHIPLERIRWTPLTFFDIPSNILLFLPLGFGLSGVLAGRNRAPGGAPNIGRRVLATGLLLGLALEAAQLFMPERVPSVADVISNGAGALLGYTLFRVWAMGVGQALDRYVTPVNLLLGLVVYALAAALLTVYLIDRARLANWDTSFPLVVGNETTGDRPWSGSMKSLQLGDRCSDPLPPNSSIYYEFSGDGPYEDSSRRGQEGPSLVWAEGPATPQGDGGVTVGPGQWLISHEPPSEFFIYARSCNDIEISAKGVSTSDAAQSGPARIVSISNGLRLRNITLGQEGDALSIRLRTPAAGDNGRKPEMLVPGVFADQRPRDIYVRYSAPMLVVWVDKELHSLSLAPGVVFFANFKQTDHWLITMDGSPHRYNIAYWALVLGTAAAIVATLVVAKRLCGPGARQKLD